MRKYTSVFIDLLVLFAFLSSSSAFFTTIGKFVDFEFYYEPASYSFIDSILFGKRKKRSANTLTKQTIHSYLVPFALRWYFHTFDFFLVFWIKVGETKQKEVALVATTFKALLSVAKTNSRLSGRKFCVGNIYYLFQNILAHISPYKHIKKCAP